MKSKDQLLPRNYSNQVSAGCPANYLPKTQHSYSPTHSYLESTTRYFRGKENVHLNNPLIGT